MSHFTLIRSIAAVVSFSFPINCYETLLYPGNLRHVNVTFPSPSPDGNPGAYAALPRMPDSSAATGTVHAELTAGGEVVMFTGPAAALGFTISTVAPGGGFCILQQQTRHRGGVTSYAQPTTKGQLEQG